MKTAWLIPLLMVVAGPEAEAGAGPFPPGAKPEKLWDKGSFTEGPAHGPGGVIYFSDIGNRIMQFDPATGKTTVFREPSGRANGLEFDAGGRLLAAEGANTGGKRRVTRTGRDGKVHVLADRWEGKRFNSPNDLTIDKKGRIYFTDPRYVGDEKREIDTESVYRIDPDGKLTRVIADVNKPNGIAFSPDMKTLYLAERTKEGEAQLLAFPVKADGSVGKKRVVYSFGKKRGIDGMSVDSRGNIYGAAGSGDDGGVYVISPEGKRLGFLPVPEVPTNCVFGGPDLKTLYITAGKSLYRVPVTIPGFAVYRPKKKGADLRPAIERGLRRLEEGSANYVKHRDCFSCHHQAVSIAVFRSAGRRGFTVDEKHLAGQIQFTLDTFRRRLDAVRKGLGVPGGNTMAGYALFALEGGGHARDEVTDALVAYLLARQRKDGAWPAVTSRPPSEGSAFINTAFALRGLKEYGPAEGKGADELAERIAKASARGRAWLLKAKPKDTEDRVGRLRGLAFAARDTEEFRDAREELLGEQNEDGSWSQLPGREGDAYATATVMLALRAAGVKADAPAYARGVKYLLKTQDESGAWIVKTRSRPVQVFFDNGDPGGKSQFISFMATGWAVLALLETVPEA